MDDGHRQDLMMILNDDHLGVALRSRLDQLGVVGWPGEVRPAVGETRQDLAENKLFPIIRIGESGLGKLKLTMVS